VSKRRKNSVFNNYTGLNHGLNNNFNNSLNNDLNNVNQEYEQEFSEELFNQQYSRLNDEDRNLSSQQKSAQNNPGSRSKSWKIRGGR